MFGRGFAFVSQNNDLMTDNKTKIEIRGPHNNNNLGKEGFWGEAAMEGNW